MKCSLLAFHFHAFFFPLSLTFPPRNSPLFWCLGPSLRCRCMKTRVELIGIFISLPLLLLPECASEIHAAPYIALMWRHAPNARLIYFMSRVFHSYHPRADTQGLWEVQADSVRRAVLVIMLQIFFIYAFGIVYFPLNLPGSTDYWYFSARCDGAERQLWV